MFLKNFLKEFGDCKLKIFVDMDGVIVDYEFGKPDNFHIKRPLLSSITKLKKISEMKNVELYILSVTRKDVGKAQKNRWLDNHAPFFKKRNRIILSRESNNFATSQTLKSDYLSELKRDGSKIIVIDDDPIVLKKIHRTNKDIILLKDTVLID